MSELELLICDDDDNFREMLAVYFGERGYQVEGVPDADGLRTALLSISPSLIILDVRMPRENGITALTKLRANSNVPVIMLTAVTETVDRIVGFELGADDYIAKPVDLRELEARIKSVLRRTEDTEFPCYISPTSSDNTQFTVGDCILDVSSARLCRADGSEIKITAMELELLKVMVVNRGRVLNRDQLLDSAHSRGWEPFDRSIDLRVSRLRSKIEKNPKKPQIIQTVRGLGYRLV